MKPRVTKDFETRSRSNLRKEGAYKYSLDPTTQPTCLAFKLKGSPTVYFLPFEVVNRPWRDQDPKLKVLWQQWIDEGAEFSAHNSFFERCIYDNIMVKKYGWPTIPPRRRRCTAAKAAACALPRSLEGAGEAMKLRIQKDKRGYNAMMATCKPTRQYNAWVKACADVKAGKRVGAKKQALAASPAPPMFLEPLPMKQIKAVLARGERDPDFKRAQIWDTLYTYCKFDVRAEEELDDELPDLLPQEQEIWFLNQMLNWRGLRVDVATVQKIVTIMEIEKHVKLKKLDALTMGLVTKPGARKSILEFLALDGIELPDLKKKTVEDALGGFELSEDMHALLEIRKALTMTSTKKYYSFLDRVNPDERVRDILLYHGASTGRDTGSGIQPHNFPRGLIKVDKRRPYAAVQNVIECDYDMLRVLYGDALGVLFSALLRNMIVPSEGSELFVADFSKIEVAVLWWLADNKPGLKILRDGLDPYKYMAAANTGLSYDEIEDEGDDRQLGKAQVLGCGFGMGPPKFQTTAYDMYRLKLTIDQAKFAVGSYRAANPAVPVLWKAYERAAIDAFENQTEMAVGPVKFRYKLDRRRRVNFLWIILPSGRPLAYADPQISWRETDFGPRKTLEFWGVNSKTKKWTLERTWGGTLTENIVQATARDLMMPAMLRLEKSGYKALLMVHDEGICEKPIGTGHVDEFVKILCEPPPWAKGLPLEAKGWNGPRYRK
jgi:DNA polymerase